MANKITSFVLVVNADSSVSMKELIKDAVSGLLTWSNVYSIRGMGIRETSAVLKISITKVLKTLKSVKYNAIVP
ncbi:MAG: hypothetical protein LBP19_08765 [Treponema sp.]|nr:hypothetical protein [Treponema sp.]